MLQIIPEVPFNVLDQKWNVTKNGITIFSGTYQECQIEKNRINNEIFNIVISDVTNGLRN